MKETPDQVYAILRQAGFNDTGAVTMTAISGAESGWDDTNVGDQSLVDDTWGTSFGLFQIRTLKAQTGTGGIRDIQALAGNDLNQARAAYAISRSGTDFSPWTDYTNGEYQQFLAQARAAAGGSAGAGAPAITPVGLTSSIFGSVRSLVITGLIVAGGAALVVAGLVKGAVPVLKPGAQRVDQAASKVAGVAAVVK